MLEVREKNLDRREWYNDTDRDFVCVYHKDDFFEGGIGLLTFTGLKTPEEVETMQGTLCIADTGYQWLELAPKGKNFVLTVMFRDGKIFQHYVDITRENVVKDDGDAVFYDLFLDVVFNDKGMAGIIDADELKEAYETGVISSKDVDLANRAADEVVEFYKNNRAKLEEKLYEYRSLVSITNMLFEHQDKEYGDFTAKLIPNLPRERFIGIRSPEYKKIVKEIGKDPVIPQFLSSLPHKYHEENCLHVALINKIKDYDECVEALEAFIPYIDNWAVNDGINPTCFKKHRGELIEKIRVWLSSEAPYTRRCAMKLLMANYLDEDFKPEYLELPADLRSDEYYVNMMTSWLFAEALVKQWDTAITYIEDGRLDPWTHNKAIQKACESFRITDEQKTYLKTLKVKIDKKTDKNK